MNKVSLVCVSKPSAHICESIEQLVAYMARVSNPYNQQEVETSGRLIRYLIENEHWSPFEMVSMTLEINTTRDIARQMLRHRSFSFQEFSQRYAVSSDFTPREARMQDNKNRQSSLKCEDKELAETWNMKQVAHIREVQKLYNWALEHGIAREQARAILPEGNTASKLYMAGTLRSWIHYCQLRIGNGTQKEHAEIAKECWKFVKQHFPQIADLYE